ncbi:(ZYRO0F03806g) [Zygosaccharomyces parabailii]|nr:(ZYRO0F03806g) [Zygosaccharomyces parabailii]CDH09671.1 uncharacterized protein ZBAI_01455 [Zygosaccharomyces bailii ISA1307]
MILRRPRTLLEYSDSIMKRSETAGASSSSSLGTTKPIRANPVDKRTYEERVFGRGLFQSQHANGPQSHGLPWEMLLSGVAIVLSSLLVILLGTNAIVQLRTIIPGDRPQMALKVVYIMLSVLGIYTLVVGNAWLYRKLAAHAHRRNANGSYNSVSRLEENYEMNSMQ